jgi:hypothetical protein
MLGLERHAPHRKEGSTEPAWGMKVHGWHGGRGDGAHVDASLAVAVTAAAAGRIDRTAIVVSTIDPSAMRTMRTRRSSRAAAGGWQVQAAPHHSAIMDVTLGAVPLLLVLGRHC